MPNVALIFVTHDLLLRSANISGGLLLKEGRALLLKAGRVEPATPRYASFLRSLVGQASDDGFRCLAPSPRDDMVSEMVFSSRRLGGDGSTDGFIMISARSLDLEEPLSGAQAVELFGLTPPRHA